MMEQNKRKKIVISSKEELKTIRRVGADKTIIRAVAQDFGVDQVIVGV